MGYLNTLVGTVLAVLLPLASPQAAPLQAAPATPSSNATQAMLLDATWAKDRVVAVGDHGMVLLSDDHGASFRQARSVPLSTPLTGVSFTDASHGWAVGHWGAILATSDGGDSWQIQRMSSEEDRPLFAVHFFDAQQGVAIGLWSLVLTTDDGGETWTEQKLDAPPGYSRADINLMGMFADSRGNLYATAERGQLLHSADRGKSWHYLDTGYEGTLWSGAVMVDGSLLVGGQRGTLLHGSANGKEWRRIPLESKSSVTAVTVYDSKVLAVGLDGLMVQSHDAGQTFEERRNPDGISLTAALFAGKDQTLLFSRRGVLPVQAR